MPSDELLAKFVVHGRWLLSGRVWGLTLGSGAIYTETRIRKRAKVGVWGSEKSMELGPLCVCSGTNYIPYMFF